LAGVIIARICARAQVLGVEALHTRDVRHTHRLLIKHILALRQINILSHTKTVLILESNLAFESQHLLHALEAANVKNWVSLSEGQQGSLGWLTVRRVHQLLPQPRVCSRVIVCVCADQRAQGGQGGSSKDRIGAPLLTCDSCRAQEQMCLLLREAMNVGKIALSDCFFSTELGDREARQRIKDELSSYCVVSEAPKTTFGKFRKVRSPLLLPRTTACQLWSLVCADLHGQALRYRFLQLHCVLFF
jgi:hypothetical protein